MLPVLTVFFFFFSSSSAADFCVADPAGPTSPAGFSCKKESAITAAKNIQPAVTPAFHGQFPGVNGRSIFPPHHPAASELHVVTILAGFISSAYAPYYATLRKGQAMVLPQGLLHFHINAGSSMAFCSMFANALPTSLISEVTFLDPEQVKKLKKVLGGKRVRVSVGRMAGGRRNERRRQ